MALMDASNHLVVSGQYGISEHSTPQLTKYFQILRQKGLILNSCTIDGIPQVREVLRKVWPFMKIQRCLVHVQRQGLMWCRRKPKRIDAKLLRKIFLKVSTIQDKHTQQSFLETVKEWEEKYGKRIVNKPELGKVFSDLKRARSMLLKALPNMFYYLDDPNIPKTTNGIEGYFSRLKHNFRNHRGLTYSKFTSYFNWYFALKCK